MVYGLNDVTGLTIVYRTKDLIKRAYESFREFYPTIKWLIIDNSGGGDCTNYLANLSDPYLTIIGNPKNYGHGSEVHRGIGIIDTKLVLMMDSDTRTVRSGGIESMLKLMNPKIYGIGEIIKTDLHGRNIPKDFEGESMDFLLLSVGLVNKEQYYKYHKITKFGLINFKANEDIHQKGKSREILINFPILQYINHYPGGTRARYGDCEDIVEGFKGSKGNMHSELD